MSASALPGRSARRLGAVRYMGNKLAFLDEVVAAASALAPEGSVLVDPMAGSHAVTYALKGRHVILSSDAQEYSAVLGRAFIDNITVRRLEPSLLRELRERAERLIATADVGFLEHSFAETYLGATQCRQLDALRQVTDELCPETSDPRRWLLLSSLLTAACRGQASTGHFAQFLPADHPRTIKLRQVDLLEVCLKTLAAMDVPSGLPGSQSWALPWRELIAREPNALGDARLWYLDPPYTRDQYSRFYHFLETLARADRPTLRFKARYRDDRFRSGFCLSTRVHDEFGELFGSIRELSPHASVLLSYSSRGLLSRDELIAAAAPNFELEDSRDVSHSYSTQGKGTLGGVTEYLLSFKPRT